MAADEKKKFCPTWLIKLISCVIVFDYIVRDKAIFFSLKKFSAFLSKNYSDTNPEEIEFLVNLIIQFLGELKVDEHTYLLINHYMFNIINDIKPNEKGLFKSDPYTANEERKYDSNEIIQEFKTFCYSCRSGLTRKAPGGWDIMNDENLGEFGEILNSEFSLDDMIENLID